MPSIERVNALRAKTGLKPMTQKEYDAEVHPKLNPEAVAPRKTPLPEGLSLDEPKKASKKKK